MLSRQVNSCLDEIREDFQSAQPFKHVCIDGFLEKKFATQLLKEFPAFQPSNAINEHGALGRKAVTTKLKEISPAYASLYEYLRSQAFLSTASEMLGIPDLVFDDAMYGGGTHENLEGQELDPHVDFNYDQVHGYHRRVNLLIYLNEEWEIDWGGAIQLHSNPWDWENDSVKTFNCEFNRCVAFETNEFSWHGFERIRFPEDKKNLSRKCISIYLYTKERPTEEIAPPHGTFYVQRPLPKDMAPGHVLTQEDVTELRGLLKKRDGWIKLYQKQELRMGAERQRLSAYLETINAALRYPVIGYVRQIDGSTYGLYADNWVKRTAGARFEARRPMQKLAVRVWVPDNMAEKQVLTVLIDGAEKGSFDVQPGEINELMIEDIGLRSGQFTLELKASAQLKNEDADERELAYILTEMEFN